MKRILICVMAFFVLVAGVAFAAQAAGTGTIKGTVSWKYTKFVENRSPNAGMSSGGINVSAWNDKKYTKAHGDSGAKIELIPVSYNKASISDVQERNWYAANQVPEGTNIFMTRADNGGYYEISGIPAGEYIMIIVSQKEKENYTYEEPTLQKYVRNWDMFNTFVLSGNEYVKRNVTIKAGEIMTQNQNFNYTVKLGITTNES